MPDRVAAMRAAIAEEPEPLVTVTHLLRLCRDEHPVLWERVSDPDCRARVTVVLTELAEVLPARPGERELPRAARHALAAALEPVDDVPAVVVAHALAELVDSTYGHTFAGSFRRRSPYQPGVGDPVPLDSPDLRQVTAMAATSPPWRLANRLDETRRVRLAGEWATRFQVVFDYSATELLAGLVTAGTVVATCHPNRSLDDFEFTRDARRRTFPVRPADPDAQLAEIDRLVARAAASGASIVVLPELCVTERLSARLRDWVRRPEGPRLLIAGSHHHEDEAGDDSPRRRNTAVGWVRGSDLPLLQDKHSPADRPVAEDIQPQGWPEIRVHVTADGWHLVIAICRDLLNPQAVHALTEAGVNLVLVPAMSETLVPFGGPVAQLVGSCQALVVVANNPAEWADTGDLVAHRPARALFGHPGFGQQTRFVHAGDPEPGVALMTVSSGRLRWLTVHNDEPSIRVGRPSSKPEWVEQLETDLIRRQMVEHRLPEQVVLRPAAVLVLVTDGSIGPRVLLTERTPDLAHYPGQLVFPGGAVEPGDDGPVAAALREAGEETGLDPDAVEVLGVLPPFALPDSGFLVSPVLAWSARSAFTGSANLAEVSTVREVPLRELLDVPRRTPGDCGALGRMTATVVDLLSGMLARTTG
ncbi:NUDIX domain-containing protein [Lentzea sp. BCCO 10_0856]|uniref:NUDIX domain-containing protein n=1 Tax=Lentzea miocenica TaxID=3095431 RepID=A0ABU4T9V3_9PSEU|nr:NUDIX domain-containing protein [Lentzea sp. BCCO 10_0856]MDX8034839.1 NUDIX domain-containing protein [Lentzea sp. BCCO 10_0856]